MYDMINHSENYFADIEPRDMTSCSGDSCTPSCDGLRGYLQSMSDGYADLAARAFEASGAVDGLVASADLRRAETDAIITELDTNGADAAIAMCEDRIASISNDIRCRGGRYALQKDALQTLCIILTRLEDAAYESEGCSMDHTDDDQSIDACDHEGCDFDESVDYQMWQDGPDFAVLEIPDSVDARSRNGERYTHELSASRRNTGSGAYYVINGYNTYKARNALRAIGCRWDGGIRKWTADWREIAPYATDVKFFTKRLGSM